MGIDYDGHMWVPLKPKSYGIEALKTAYHRHGLQKIKHGLRDIYTDGVYWYNLNGKPQYCAVFNVPAKFSMESKPLTELTEQDYRVIFSFLSNAER